MAMTRFVSKFATVDEKTYVGWWEDKKFHSQVFSDAKSANKLYKELKAKEEIE